MRPVATPDVTAAARSDIAHHLHPYTQLRQLEADCTARGGILTPTQQQTGRPQTDNACRITGGASRIPGN